MADFGDIFWEEGLDRKSIGLNAPKLLCRNVSIRKEEAETGEAEDCQDGLSRLLLPAGNNPLLRLLVH